MELRKDLMMQVDGMTCDGCVQAVTKVIHRLDSKADVEVDLAHGRVRIETTASSLELSDALTKAGYTAHAMTG